MSCRAGVRSAPSSEISLSAPSLSGRSHTLPSVKGSDENASSEVMLFLDGGDLYATGEAAALDVVLTDLLGRQDDSRRRRSVTKLADAGAVVAGIGAAAMPAEELFRLTPDAMAKLAQHGGQLTDGGALRGFVRS